MRDLITRLPKAELHVHIEGTLEPEMMFALGDRNGFELPFEGVDQIRAAYQFNDLQSFLDIYYQGAAVLRTPEDFYDLMTNYLERAAADGVRRAEIFFDPQTHTERGISFPSFMSGFREAILDAERHHDLSADLILCFLRHRTAAEALETLHQAEDHLEKVIAVGLDSSEVGRPPELFEAAFAEAGMLGLRAVAHAGEEGPPSYVAGALDSLGAERIEHGIRSLEDPKLVARLRAEQIPLTVCPLSNVSLRIVGHLSEHPLPTMIEAGLMVTVNSDDPAYFGGYVGENYVAVASEFDLSEQMVAELARNSILASFLDDDAKEGLLTEIDDLVDSGVAEE